jgi:hypothetical protein
MSQASSQNSTELLDRYLHAVRFWLPKAQQQDIVAELSEDLNSQIEEKQAELGRKLNETEVDAILKQRGRPLLVANRYLPQRSLIGPVLFPIYWFVLKIVALCYLLPWILVWIGMMSFSSSYRAGHMGTGLFGAISSAWSGLWLIACATLGTVTLVFAILEHVQAKSRFLEDWSPRKLPPVRDPNRISRFGSIVEVVVNVVFAIWWIEIMSSRVLLDRPELKIVLAPVWRYFFWGFVLSAMFNVVLAGVNLARPYWTVVRAGFRLTTDCAGAALFCWMLKASLLGEITGAHIPPARATEFATTINMWMARAFPYGLVVLVIIALADLYRVFRVRKTVPAQVTGRVSAAVV